MMSHNESPASVNVRLTSDHNADIQLTLRSGVTLDEAKALLDTLAATLKYAAATYHLTPAPRLGRSAAADLPATGEANGNGAAPPVCPTHGKPMKPSQHGGWYCPQKLLDDDGSGKPVYCKHKSK